jgi:acetyl esterase
MLDADIANHIGPPTALPALTPDILPMIRAGMAEIGRSLPGIALPRVEDFDAEGVPVRLYASKSAENLPLLVFLHGGGWMLGDLETHDAMLRHIAFHGECAVLGVGYRLAPEHPFPAGLDDCLTAYHWAHRMAATLGIDPYKVALGGESAGANLTAAITLKLRDEQKPQPLFQLLIHPVTTFSFEYPSLNEIESAGISADYMISCRNMYLGDTDPAEPLASPMMAADHAGLAPAIILTASEDPLRDDGEFYARALNQSGVETLVQRLDGLPHGFLFLPTSIPAVLQANELVGKLVRRYFLSL